MTAVILIRERDNTPVGAVMTEGRGWIGDPDNPGRNLASPVTIGWRGEGYRCVEFVPFVPPAGKRETAPRTSSYDGARVVETAPTEDIPPAPVLTAAEKLDRMARDYDFADAADLRAAIDALEVDNNLTTVNEARQ